MTTKEGAELVKAAKKRGVKVTAETCPHYLVLNAKDSMSERGSFAKIAPPLREPVCLMCIGFFWSSDLSQLMWLLPCFLYSLSTFDGPCPESNYLPLSVLFSKVYSAAEQKGITLTEEMFKDARIVGE